VDNPVLAGNPGTADAKSDVERIQRMLRSLKDSDAAQSNSQMQQWNSMLDKIITIQHPQARDSIRSLSAQNRGKGYPVSPGTGPGNSISLLEAADTGRDLASVQRLVTDKASISFYGLDDRQEGKEPEQNAISATIDETQTLLMGSGTASDIRLRLTSDLFVDGVLIPVGTSLTGLANLSGDRLKVEISAIHYGSTIYSVA